METRANHVWVGTVTLVLLAAISAFVIWIARLGQHTLTDYDIFFAQSVDGLSKGSAVNFSGVPIGQVKLIELWKRDPGKVHVRISVQGNVPIREGTTASIQSGFTGVSNIQLDGASKDAAPIVAPGPEGVPVIPTKRSGLGELLNSAPVLMQKLTTLTERLSLTLSDQNQRSLQHILSNTDQLTGSLAHTAPQLNTTLGELHTTLRQAQITLAAFETTAASADTLLNGQAAPLADQLRATLKTAQGAADRLQQTLGDAAPVAQRLNQQTLPQAEAAMRDLRSATRALRDVTEKLDTQGGKALLGGGDDLPDYKP